VSLTITAESIAEVEGMKFSLCYCFKATYVDLNVVDASLQHFLLLGIVPSKTSPIVLIFQNNKFRPYCPRLTHDIKACRSTI
jgi:hypothetical protein